MLTPSTPAGRCCTLLVLAACGALRARLSASEEAWGGGFPVLEEWHNLAAQPRGLEIFVWTSPEGANRRAQRPAAGLVFT